MTLFEEPNGAELAVLQSIASRSYAPHLSEVAADFGCTRQAVYYWVRRLRRKGLLEDGPGNGPKTGLMLSHNGRIVVATSAP